MQALDLEGRTRTDYEVSVVVLPSDSAGLAVFTRVDADEGASSIGASIARDGTEWFFDGKVLAHGTKDAIRALRVDGR